MILSGLRRWLAALWRRGTALAPIPDELWSATLAQWRFLADGRSPQELERLRQLAAGFIARKRFHGAHGLQVTDAMAVSVAAQACLPLLHFAPAGQPQRALRWYDDFVVIVLQPGEALAPREMLDEAGVVHQYHEALVGEAMERGPVMLSWSEVMAAASDDEERGSSVVIHEFIHKLDMRHGGANGCPPLPPGFLGSRGAAGARKAWLAVLEPAWQDFREQVIKAERFGADWPWLDAYGAESLIEFLPVACEAYFVRRARFAMEFPSLLRLFDAFFQRPAAS